jgi:hypothetical protein
MKRLRRTKLNGVRVRYHAVSRTVGEPFYLGIGTSCDRTEMVNEVSPGQLTARVPFGRLEVQKEMLRQMI